MKRCEKEVSTKDFFKKREASAHNNYIWISNSVSVKYRVLSRNRVTLTKIFSKLALKQSFRHVQYPGATYIPVNLRIRTSKFNNDNNVAIIAATTTWEISTTHEYAACVPDMQHDDIRLRHSGFRYRKRGNARRHHRSFTTTCSTG